MSSSAAETEKEKENKIAEDECIVPIRPRPIYLNRRVFYVRKEDPKIIKISTAVSMRLPMTKKIKYEVNNELVDALFALKDKLFKKKK
ncbi:MAG: hypothetical protein MJ252_18435 [archaeon]|nr:hypothetical protein [archaeon]